MPTGRPRTYAPHLHSFACHMYEAWTFLLKSCIFRISRKINKIPPQIYFLRNGNTYFFCLWIFFLKKNKKKFLIPLKWSMFGTERDPHWAVGCPKNTFFENQLAYFDSSLYMGQITQTIFLHFLTLLEVPTWPPKPFLYILYKFLYSLTVKKSKMSKKGSFFNFFIQEFFS